ncbi:MAG: hypothetical protein JWM32_2936, partial [Verrucomicrobia bacterium]|nr:hypothetical protein [Verrucomicrobiota bacterium]
PEAGRRPRPTPESHYDPAVRRFHLDPSTLGNIDESESRDPPRRFSPFVILHPKNLVIGCLGLALAAVSVMAWRQQSEIERMRPAPRAPAVSSPTVSFRRGTSQHVALPPAERRARWIDDGNNARYPGQFDHDSDRPEPPPRGALAWVQLLEQPEFRSLLKTYQVGALDARFAGLFRKLNLDANELAAFKGLLSEKENAEFEVVVVNDANPVNPLSPEEVASSVRAVRSELEGAIMSSLGADRYATYRDYEQTLPQRATVAQLEQRLSYSATPLSVAQSESLVKIMAVHAPASEAVLVSPGAMPAGEGGASPVVRQASGGAAVVTDEAVTEARAVLSPGQVAAFRQIQVEQQSAVSASQLLHSAFPGGAEPPPALWKILLQ